MSEFNIPTSILYAIPFFTVAILAEYFYITYGNAKGRYDYEDVRTSLSMGVGYLLTIFFFGVIPYTILMLAWPYRFFDLETTYWVILLAFFADDFRFYVFHRISHRCRWGWANHINHHSSRHFNFTTALRQTWTIILTGLFMLQIPLVLLGFHPTLIAFVFGINLTYQFLIHTETIEKMPGWFEAIFNTPSHHRVHHAANPRYLDANYGGTLIIWDRLFGTFVPEQNEAPRYGLVNNIGTFNIFKVAFHEWAAMLQDAFSPGLTIGQRAQYFFRPPGWRHDGAHNQSTELKANYVTRHPNAAGEPGLPD